MCTKQSVYSGQESHYIQLPVSLQLWIQKQSTEAQPSENTKSQYLSILSIHIPLA